MAGELTVRVGQDQTPITLFGDPIVEEARKRFDRVAEFEAVARARFLEDIRFANADSDNGYQWPNAIRRMRDVDSRPCLTINVTRQHNLQITNEALQNKSSIKIIPMGGGATVDSAQGINQLIRHIEYMSNAQSIYKVAQGFQVDGGIGWWRIVVDWAPGKTFDQEIYLLPVQDPLSVYIDCDCKQTDKSDAEFGLVFADLDVDKFRSAYPNFKGDTNHTPLGVTSVGDTWPMKNQIKVAEYFRKVKDEDQLASFVSDVDGRRRIIQRSLVPKEVWTAVKLKKLTMVRKFEATRVEWHLIAGEEIVDSTDWVGPDIPLIPVIGQEVVIDGILDRKGHTRYMKDSQRMYNYNASAQVEFVALQAKTPWVAPAKAIEQFESIWGTANQVNHSYLPWNHVDDENPEKLIPPPFRVEPPNAAPAYEAGMKTAFEQMMMSSGQWQNQMGMMGNERTGQAIRERQSQSDTSTFHFADNFADAKRNCGKQLLRLIPLVYRTKRVKNILADDGSNYILTLDPTQQQVFQQMMDKEGMVVQNILNPRIGDYDVAADVGPAYGSKREETANALTLILTQAPGLTGLIGDLLLESLDFDKAQEAAQRLKRMIPPQALGRGPTPEVQQLQSTIQSLQVALAKALERTGHDKLKLVGKDQMRDIESYRAETERFKALSDSLGLDPDGVKSVVRSLVEEALHTHLTPIIQANQKGIGFQDEEGNTQTQVPPDLDHSLEQPPITGAKKAPDGNWYILDPTRKGKFLRIAPLAEQGSPSGR